MKDNFIDLSSDDSVISSGNTSSVEKGASYNEEHASKRKVSQEDEEMNISPTKIKKVGENSSPSKFKKEKDNVVVEELLDKNTDTVMEFNLTNVRSTIRKKLPLEGEDAVLATVLTERVTISSPKRTPLVGKSKLPLEDDEVVVLDIGTHLKSALNDFMNVSKFYLFLWD